MLNIDSPLLTGNSNSFFSIMPSTWSDLDKGLVGLRETEMLLSSVNLGRSLSDRNRNLLLTGILDLVLIFLDVDDAVVFAAITCLT